MISRLGTSQNLGSGETYDLLMMSFSEGFPVGAVTFEFGNTPRKITGIQKVVQTFLKILLTNKGSDIVYPSLGTEFPSLTVNTNISYTDSDLYSAIASAIKDASDQAKEILNVPGIAVESQLRSVELRGLFMQNSTMNIALRITSEAGIQGNIAMPFPETDLTKAS